MVFGSLIFIFGFLPVFFPIYYLVPVKGRNLVLFAGSLAFYGYGVKEEPEYFWLLLLSVLVNYLCGVLIGRSKTRGGGGIWLGAGLFYNVGLLLFFKYTDFLLETGNRIASLAGFGEVFSLLHLVLPVGISFYTFQSISYLVDVYRGDTRYESSLIAFGAYLCMFPQLIAGPIVTHARVRRQLRHKAVCGKNTEEGLREFTIGLGMKVLVANQMGRLWGQVEAIGFESISTPMAWLGLAAFSFQIYFDFYGYSRMARGLGLMLGFYFPDNFQDPYLSGSVTEFWRRWHMTLGSWFREYVYIPLGGNRAHLLRNTLAVWLLTGLWHGASWNFVLWGLLHCGLILMEKAGLKRILAHSPFRGHLYMSILIPLSWLLFAVPDLAQARLYFLRCFPFPGQETAAVFAGDFLKYGEMYAISLSAALLLCTGIPGRLYRKYKTSLAAVLFLLAVFWGSVWCMHMGMEDPFLYFRF